MQPSPLCSSRTLPSPQKETLHPSAVSPHPPLTAQPLASTSLWFCPWLWIYPFWAFPNRRSPITRSLWCLAFFIQRDVFRVRPHCSKDCSTLSSADGNLGVFHLLANRVVVNACVQVSVWYLSLSPWGSYLGVEFGVCIYSFPSSLFHSALRFQDCSVLFCAVVRVKGWPFSQVSHVHRVAGLCVQSPLCVHWWCF